MISFKDVYDLESLLHYCTDHLLWPIDFDDFEDIEDITYDFYPDDLGLSEESFGHIRYLKQVRPLVDNQPWGIFALDFESKSIEISTIRKILGRLVPNRNNFDHKTWNYDRLLFLCFWGEPAYRSVGFLAFEKSKLNASLPTIKSIYCTPAIEDRAVLENIDHRLEKLRWPDRTTTNWAQQWSDAFRYQRGQIIKDSKTITEKLAEKALSISQQLRSGFNVETSDGSLHSLYNRFNRALNITLSVNDFIDMYSQTLVYGLFSARCMRPDNTPFSVNSAIESIPLTNPLLKELLHECCYPSNGWEFDELDVLDLIELLDSIDVKGILDDFNRQSGLGKEDPIIYFYEGFLDIYEKEQKKRRGVYYTPMPIVDFMVKSVSHLLKSRYKCSQGFMSPKVSILDPAAGTGTFLRKIIYEIYDEFIKHSPKDQWSNFVSSSLLTRLFGFEFMMAPYAVAHMKLAMALDDTGYDFTSEKRLQVYLANSLENTDESPSPADFNDPLVRESSFAASVKRGDINVIIGNPPYRTDSVNKGEWIMSLMADYKKEPGSEQRLHERNPKVVNDDYVKFIRFAQEVLKTKEDAVIAYIHPHSYMDNLTFRGMRWNLLQNFSEIYTLDLHGNAMSREVLNLAERDENVFDIQQGVCITFLVKTSSSPKPGKVFYADICGSRASKYEFLTKKSFNDVRWAEILPSAPYYFFKPKNLSNARTYENGVKLSELFPLGLGGIKTHDDTNLVSDVPFDTGNDQLYDYRPFDTKHLDYDLSKVERARYDVMKHFIGHKNIGIVLNRQVVTDNWSHIQIVEHMIDNRLHYSRKGIPVLCPLYIFEGGHKKPNVSMELIKQFENATGMEFKDEDPSPLSFSVVDLADYCYAVLHSPSYRVAYQVLLSIDFPRVPYPISRDAFIKLTKFGAQLRRLHTLNEPVENTLNIQFCGVGNSEVKTPVLTNGRLKINSTQYFSNITNELWDFCFGGYHGLQKWFKDRRNHLLTPSDIEHVIKVFNIFELTGNIMDEIDLLFEEYGITF